MGLSAQRIGDSGHHFLGTTVRRCLGREGWVRAPIPLARYWTSSSLGFTLLVSQSLSGRHTRRAFL